MAVLFREFAKKRSQAKNERGPERTLDSHSGFAGLRLSQSYQPECHFWNPLYLHAHRPDICKDSHCAVIGVAISGRDFAGH